MTQPTQTIDISPEKASPIAQAGLRLLSLETTLVPGNLRAQLAVLEIYLSGLATGQLVLAPAPKAAVESGAKNPDFDSPGKDANANDSRSSSDSPRKT